MTYVCQVGQISGWMAKWLVGWSPYLLDLPSVTSAHRLLCSARVEGDQTLSFTLHRAMFAPLSLMAPLDRHLWVKVPTCWICPMSLQPTGYFAQQLQTTEPGNIGDFNPQVDPWAKLSPLLKCEGPRWLIGWSTWVANWSDLIEDVGQVKVFELKGMTASCGLKSLLGEWGLVEGWRPYWGMGWLYLVIMGDWGVDMEGNGNRA